MEVYKLRQHIFQLPRIHIYIILYFLSARPSSCLLPDSVYLFVRSDIFGQTQDTVSRTSEDDKSRCCALILSGIVEVLLNTIATEMEKATDIEKVDLLKELIDFVNHYDFLKKSRSTSRQRNGIKRGNLRTAVHDIPDSTDLGHMTLSQARIPFLATSSIYQLLQTFLDLYNIDFSNGITTSQNCSQSSSGKTLVCTSKMISFVLNVSLHQIKSFTVLGKDDPLKTLIYGEIEMLGPPLLKLIWLLKSEPKLEADQKKKEGKGRKDVEDRKEHLHLALVCLKELIKICLQNPHQTSLLEDLVSLSTVEYPLRNVADVGSDDECEIASGTDDQNIKSKVLLIKRCVRPLFSELLGLSFLREVEVNSLLSVSFQSCTFFNQPFVSLLKIYLLLKAKPSKAFCFFSDSM